MSDAVIKAAMSIARDSAEGRLLDADLDQALADECKALFGTVIGPSDPLFDLQVAVARGVLAAGGIPADELTEWAAVARRLADTDPSPADDDPAPSGD